VIGSLRRMSVDSVISRANGGQRGFSGRLLATRAGIDEADRRSPERVLPSSSMNWRNALARRWRLLSDRECLTFRALAQRAAPLFRAGRLTRGLARATFVCLLMPNRPEYVAIWLGITRVGAVVVSPQHQPGRRSLAHCIDVVAPRHVIVADELVETFVQARQHVASDARVWSHGRTRFDGPISQTRSGNAPASHCPTPNAVPRPSRTARC